MKIKKFFFILLLLFISAKFFAQKENNLWYFGKNAGMDFNSGKPVALSGGQINTEEGCASISDRNGHLLFYTDGITVWKSFDWPDFFTKSKSS